MIRLLAGTALLGLAGCVAVPAPVLWSTVGSVAGFGAKAFEFDKDVFDWWRGREVAPPAPRPPDGCNDFSGIIYVTKVCAIA